MSLRRSSLGELMSRTHWPKAPKWNRRYGLIEDLDMPSDSGEAAETVEVQTALSESFFDDVHGTAKSLDKLRQHPDFSKWLKKSQLSPRELELVDKRLKVYQDLRQLDPESFQRILIEPLHCSSQACNIAQHLCHYCLNTLATALILLVVLLSVSQAVRWLALSCLVYNIFCWTRATSAFGVRQSLYFEDLTLGHKAPWKAVILMNISEVIYVVLTLGLGGLLSMGLAASGPSRQSLFEKLFKVRLVQEKVTRVELGSTVSLEKRRDLAIEVEAFQQSPDKSSFSIQNSGGSKSLSPKRRRGSRKS